MRPTLLALVLVAGCGEAPVGLEQPTTAQPSAIINGERSEPGDFPAVGALLVHGNDAYFGEFGAAMCTATLVAPDTILLAAHCLDTSMFYGADVDFYFSFSENVQSYGSTTMTLPANTYAVTDSVVHSSFNMQAFEGVAGPGNYYDVAVAFLDTEVTNRAPALVMGPNDSHAIQADTPVQIVGYGMRTANYDPYNPDPNDSGVKYHADTFINEVGTTEMQVGDTQPVPQKCHGDSGGPTFLTYDDDMTPARRLVGITSHAYDESDCHKGGVDTRVDSYRSWIEGKMVDACTSGVRQSCENGGVLAQPFQPAPPPPPSSPGTYQRSSKYEQDNCSQTRAEPLVALLVLLPWLRRLRRRPRSTISRN